MMHPNSCLKMAGEKNEIDYTQKAGLWKAELLALGKRSTGISDRLQALGKRSTGISDRLQAPRGESVHS